MASFLNDVTSKYLCKQLSGQMLDEFSLHDSDSNNVLSFNGESFSYDGIGDSTTWSFGNTPFTPNLDWSGYIDIEIDDDWDGFIAYLITTSLITDNRGPLIRYRGDSGLKQFDFLSHASAGSALATITFPRLFNIGERVGLTFSYDASAITANIACETDQGLVGSATDTGTVGIGWSSPGEIRFARRHESSIFTQVTLNETGYIDGTVRSLVDCEDTATAILESEGPVDTELQRRRGLYFFDGGHR